MKRSRLVPFINRRGAVCGAGVILIPLFGFLARTELGTIALLLELICAIAMVLLVVRWLSARRALASLRIEVRLAPELIAAREATCELQFTRTSNKSSYALNIRPGLPHGCEYEPRIERILFRAGEASKCAVFSIHPYFRGTLLMNDLWLRIIPRGVWGASGITWQARCNLETPVSALVLPDSAGMRVQNDQAFVSRPVGLHIVDQFRGEGREFDSLRLYAAGDDPRRIDWKRSARTSHLLVRTYRPETHQRVTIALDCSRRMGTRIEKRLLFDYAVDAAAFLARLAANYDDEVGLFAFHHDIVAQVRNVKISRRSGAFDRVLANLTPSTTECDYDLLGDWARENRRRSLLVLLSSISNPFTLELMRERFLRLSRKHVVLVVAIADRSLERAAQSRAENLDDAYMIAAAYDQRAEITRRVEMMRQSGIECVYTDVAFLPEALRREYQRLKASGRL